MAKLKALNIANFLNSELIGPNITVNNVASLSNAKKSSLIFSKKCDFQIDLECLILVPSSYEGKKDSNLSIIKANNPKLAFAKVLNKFFSPDGKPGIHPSTHIGNGCDINPSVAIGFNSSIGNNVKIGRNTIIKNNVVIYDNSTIGENCYIKSGSIIGEEGFGFAFEENGTPIRIPHLGKVIIGNNVEIGALCTIARGTIEDTIICDNVKTDDQVHLAHNCYVGENTIITACSEISGSVTIGANCWIAPNSSITDNVKIGDNVTIGIGSGITKDVEPNKKIMGLEGMELRSLIKLKKLIKS